MLSSHRRLIKSIAGILLAIPFILFGLSLDSSAHGKIVHEIGEGSWVYLRGGQPPFEREGLVEIIAVGDVMPGRGLADQPGLFHHVSELLHEADLVVGNLEGVMAPLTSLEITPSLHIPTTAADSLSWAGFDLLGLANNHTLDAGQVGLSETTAQLQTVGIQPLQHDQPFFREVRGVKLGFLAWSDIPPSDRVDLFIDLDYARIKSDILIVLVHWGQEYQRHPNLSQRELADQLFQAGVDIIIGSHPHVVQDLELIRTDDPQEPAQLVAYSLGNFAFDQGWDDTAHGLALSLLLDTQGLRAVKVLPLRTTPRPSWIDPSEAVDLLDRILPVERLGFTCPTDTCRVVEVPQERHNGLFWSGGIDLTGDGRPEIIRRLGQTVEIYQEGLLAWHSPEGWLVRDLALGDPNHDGRYEIVMALQKSSSSGNLTSHPFVLGYRGGIYRVLWGGSPVSNPILEVALGDLDGDGLEELAVIESSSGDDTHYLTLWRWHGWGFSKVWRSPPGDYRSLIILPASKNLLPRLSISTDSPP